MPPRRTSPEKAPETGAQYKQQLGAILSRELTPENINNYAEGALTELIDLTQSATGTFSAESRKSYDTPRDLEEEAFKHYGLSNIDSILDYVADKAQQLHEIDALISGAHQTDTIILPPDAPNRAIVPSPAPSEKKPDAAKLKTLLFILANDFDVDLHDPSQVSAERGSVDANMMRRDSYYSVDIPVINRLVLICDDPQNATFVFDSQRLSENGLSTSDVSAQTKSQLDELLQIHPGMGSKMRYSNKFVSRLIKTLECPGKTPEQIEAEARKLERKSYLVPDALPEDRSVKRLAEELGLDRGLIEESILRREADLEQITTKRFRNIATRALSLYNQAVIEDDLRRQGLVVPPAPENVTALATFVKTNRGFGYEVAKDALDRLVTKKTINPTTYRFGSVRSLGLTDEEAATLLASIQTEQAPKAPEGSRSGRSLADYLGTDKSTVARASTKLVTELGDVKKGIHHNQTSQSYNPTQQLLIALHIDGRTHARGRIDPQKIEELRQLASEYEAEQSKSDS